MQLSTVKTWVAWSLAVVLVGACAADDFGKLGKKKASKDESGGEAKAFTRKTRPSPEGFGVELVGQQLTIGQVGPTTCPKYPGKNNSTDERAYVPDGPARAYVDKAGKTRLIIPHLLTYAWVGDSLESAGLDCGTVVADSNQNRDPDALDDTAWPWAVYRLDDGRAMTLYHMEFHPRAHPGAFQCPAGEGAYDNSVCPWYSAITWGIAEDGVRFGHGGGPGNVAAKAPETGYPRVTGGLGYSDHSNIMRNQKDGKYYVAVLSRGLHDGGGIGVCMMRSDDLADPASWKIFTGNAYDGSGRNGSRCKNVIPSGSVVPGSLTYNTYLKRFVLLVFGHPAGRDDGFYMYVSKNDELTDWTEPVQVLDSRLPWGQNGQVKNSAMEAYPSFLPFEATNGNFDVTGEEAYLYWVRWKAQDISGVRDVMRVKVKFLKDREEIENPTAPMKGLYRVDGGGYYANGAGQYCSIGSMEQLRGCGWTAPFDDLPPFSSNVEMQDDGRCTCGMGGGQASTASQSTTPPDRGCYRIGPAGFFSNGAGQSCGLLGPFLNAMCGTPDFNALPARGDHASNQLQTPCILPRTCYAIGGGGFFSNGEGQSCPFLGNEMQGYCGTADFNSLAKLEGHGGNTVNPPCNPANQQPPAQQPPPNQPPAPPPPPAPPAPLAQSCYRIGATGFFSNGGGQSCTLLGANLQDNCGTSNFNALAARNDHGGNNLNGACILPRTCYKIGPTGFFSNGGGQSCPFLGGQMQGICGTTDFNALRDMGGHGGNVVNGQCQ